ncbi:MAG: FG-GAP-like repeat-containing protein [Bacteroidota bacterium]
MTNTLLQIYQHTSKNYRKFSNRLNKKIRNGSFSELSKYKQYQLRKRVSKLREKLIQLERQIKLAVAAGTITLALSISSVSGQTTLGPFINAPRSENPLRPPIDDNGINHELVDIDGDGDVDLFFGNSTYGDNRIRFFENVQINDGQVQFNEPRFDEREGSDNPYSMFNATGFGLDRGEITFADLDGDGDLDAITKFRYPSTSRSLYFFENDGRTFVDRTGYDNDPLSDLSYGEIGYGDNIAIANIDNDADPELIVSERFNLGITVFELNAAGKFEDQGQIIGNSDFEYRNINPTLIDIDTDGDLDVIAGIFNYGGYNYERGTLALYLNDGSGIFSEADDPLEALTFYEIPFVDAIDIDMDGDEDLIIALDPKYSDESPILFYENVGSPTLSNFEERLGLDNPFGGVDLGEDSSPATVDLDQDGDQDILVGGYIYYGVPRYEAYGRIQFFENTGSEFERNDDRFFDYLSNELSLNTETGPFLVDLDKDGDQDFLITNDQTDILFFEGQEGTFVEQIGTDNPFNDLNQASYNSYPTKIDIIDIDNDGDLDCFVGKYRGTLFLRNEANPEPSDTNPQTPSFTLFGTSSVENPLSDMSYSSNGYRKPSFVDVDGDGDFDVIAGSGDGIFFYENIGNPQSPSFELFDANNSSNPFSTIEIQSSPSPITIDIDNDGDADLLVGNQEGTIEFLRNDNPGPRSFIGGTNLLINEGDESFFTLEPDFDFQDFEDVSNRILADPITKVEITINNFAEGEETLSVINNTPTISDSLFVDNSDPNNIRQVLCLEIIQGIGTETELRDLARTVEYQFSGSTSNLRQGRNQRTTITDREITFQTFDVEGTRVDENGNSTAVSKTISIVNPNEIPNLNSDNPEVSASFSIGGNPVPVDNALTVIDLDDIDFASVTFILEPDSRQDGDELLFDGITNDDVIGSFDTDLGQLTITSASQEFIPEEDIELAMQGVLFNTSSSSTQQRIVSVIINDGEDDSPAFTRIIGLGSEGEIQIINAVAPAGTPGVNDFFQINSLPVNSSVSIFNRWGDRVFEQIDYDGTGTDLARTFVGNRNVDGSEELTSGTYYYRILTGDGQEFTGFLVLRR